MEGLLRTHPQEDQQQEEMQKQCSAPGFAGLVLQATRRSCSMATSCRERRYPSTSTPSAHWPMTHPASADLDRNSALRVVNGDTVTLIVHGVLERVRAPGAAGTAQDPGALGGDGACPRRDCGPSAAQGCWHGRGCQRHGAVNDIGGREVAALPASQGARNPAADGDGEGRVVVRSGWGQHSGQERSAERLGVAR
jgi:hypothetical protein